MTDGMMLILLRERLRTVELANDLVFVDIEKASPEVRLELLPEIIDMTRRLLNRRVYR